MGCKLENGKWKSHADLNREPHPRHYLPPDFMKMQNTDAANVGVIQIGP